jgi:hypothetical protein
MADLGEQWNHEESPMLKDNFRKSQKPDQKQPKGSQDPISAGRNTASNKPLPPVTAANPVTMAAYLSGIHTYWPGSANEAGAQNTDTNQGSGPKPQTNAGLGTGGTSASGTVFQVQANAPNAGLGQAPQPGQNELLGQVVNGNYRIDQVLAEGGMGQVFLAHHLRRDIPVVLKLMLHFNGPQDPLFVRFVEECKVTLLLQHPNLVLVLDWGLLLGSLKPYLVMEYVEGKSLRQILRLKSVLSPSEAAAMLVQVCLGLEEVHAHQIIHRDLKPENIMVRGEAARADNVKILDFGIAQTREGANPMEAGCAVGSIGYMSPEQICGQPVDYRTDIYSLGVIFYEMIVGRQPFVADSVKAIMAKHVVESVVPPSEMVPSLPNHVLIDRIIDRAMAKDPQSRYQSVDEMRRDLQFLIGS